MTLTLGGFLQRLEKEPDSRRRFSAFMPTAHGPCRFGAYRLSQELVFRRLGLSNRIRVFSLWDEDYFATVGPGFAGLLWAGFCAGDLLLEALHHARPAETIAGAAQKIYNRHRKELLDRVRQEAVRRVSRPRLATEVLSGHCFGMRKLLLSAADAFRASTNGEKRPPTVLVAGEIYVRCDPCANMFVIEEL